jgi:hypothetical protein
MARLKGQAGPQPLDLDSQTVGIVVEPVIGLVRRAIPVDDAPIAQHLKLGTRKEVLQRAPKHDLIGADNP